MSETNYERYFGTPEKAAEMAKLICYLFRRCDGCPFDNADCGGLNGTEVWLEWLESEAE